VDAVLLDDLKAMNEKSKALSFCSLGALAGVVAEKE